MRARICAWMRVHASGTSTLGYCAVSSARKTSNGSCETTYNVLMPCDVHLERQRTVDRIGARAVCGMMYVACQASCRGSQPRALHVTYVIPVRTTRHAFACSRQVIVDYCVVLGWPQRAHRPPPACPASTGLTRWNARRSRSENSGWK